MPFAEETGCCDGSAEEERQNVCKMWQRRPLGGTVRLRSEKTWQWAEPCWKANGQSLRCDRR
eukprot:5308230-Heterocapsa_arctica.AAC.1